MDTAGPLPPAPHQTPTWMCPSYRVAGTINNSQRKGIPSPLLKTHCMWIGSILKANAGYFGYSSTACKNIWLTVDTWWDINGHISLQLLWSIQCVCRRNRVPKGLMMNEVGIICQQFIFLSSPLWLLLPSPFLWAEQNKDNSAGRPSEIKIMST